MIKKSFLFPLFSLALLAAFTPRTAQATTTTITIGSLSTAPFSFFITEPANDPNDVMPEDSLDLTITGGTWVAPFTVLVTESGKGDGTKGTPSDILTFFNDASGARVCGQSFPIDPGVQPCPVIASNIFHGVDGGGGGGGDTGVPAKVEFQTSAGATVLLSVSACGGPGSCGSPTLSDGVRIALAPATPEPATLALLGTGILSVGLRMRRRKKAA